MMMMLHCGGEGFFFRSANRLSPLIKINHRHRHRFLRGWRRRYRRV